MQNNAYKQWKRSIQRRCAKNRVPGMVEFELTPRCNLDCKMCYIHNQESNACVHRELSTEQWKKIFDDAIDNGMLFANLTGGECLLRKDFKELYLYLQQKGVFVSVLTNGILADEEYVEFFRTHTPDTIQITLYGSSEDGYLAVTGHRGFERVTRNIKMLQEAGINLKIVVTANKHCIDDYINIIKFIKDQKIPCELGEMFLSSKRDDPSENDSSLTKEQIVELSVERGKLFGALTPMEHTPEPVGPMTKPAHQGLTCGGGNGTAHITWEGKMYPCPNVMIGGASLLEMSFADAWEHTKAAADKVVYGIECVDCPYDKVCPKCPTYRLLDLESGHCNPAVCEITRKLVAAGVKKLDIPENT